MRAANQQIPGALRIKLHALKKTRQASDDLVNTLKPEAIPELPVLTHLREVAELQTETVPKKIVEPRALIEKQLISEQERPSAPHTVSESDALQTEIAVNRLKRKAVRTMMDRLQKTLTKLAETEQQDPQREETLKHRIDELQQNLVELEGKLANLRQTVHKLRQEKQEERKAHEENDRKQKEATLQQEWERIRRQYEAQVLTDFNPESRRVIEWRYRLIPEAQNQTFADTLMPYQEIKEHTGISEKRASNLVSLARTRLRELSESTQWEKPQTAEIDALEREITAIIKRINLLNSYQLRKNKRATKRPPDPNTDGEVKKAPNKYQTEKETLKQKVEKLRETLATLKNITQEQKYGLPYIIKKKQLSLNALKTQQIKLKKKLAQIQNEDPKQAIAVRNKLAAIRKQRDAIKEELKPLYRAMRKQRSTSNNSAV
jgi:chromosome segregation ATPase